MNEVEIKILEIDKEAVEQELKTLGAKIKFEGEVKSYFYDKPGSELGGNGKTLRLREMGDNTKLTFKGPQKTGNAKIREELEISLEDSETVKGILEELGFERVDEDTKTRTSYTLDGASIEIDEYPDIPALLEVEHESIEKISRIVSQLGFSMDDSNNWSRGDLLKHYGKR